MRLVCVECSAAYEAPDKLFGPQPREVRCNRCGYQWSVVASVPEVNAGGPDASVAPAAAPAPMSSSPQQAPRPAPAPMMRTERIAAPPPPPPPPPQAPARRKDALADALTPTENLAAHELPKPTLVVEPAAASTRTLLASAPRDDGEVMGPDPEERRLSHELDFGTPERQWRRSRGGGGTRRAVVILILLIIVVGIAAVMFETQIVAAVPALAPIYAQLGL